MIKDSFYRKRADIDYIQEKQKSNYYCPVCGHTMTFINNQERKLCGWCGLKVDRPRLTVETVCLIERLKRRYKIFLKKKEGI